MTDEEYDAARITVIEKWLAATDQCIPVFAIRWLLADWRRLKDLCESRDGTIERLVEDKEALRLDAARWREARSRGWVLVSESCVDAAIAKEQADGKA